MQLITDEFLIVDLIIQFYQIKSTCNYASGALILYTTNPTPSLFPKFQLTKDFDVAKFEFLINFSILLLIKTLQNPCQP